MIAVLEMVAKGSEDSGSGGGIVILLIVGLFLWTVFFGGKGKTKK